MDVDWVSVLWGMVIMTVVRAVVDVAWGEIRRRQWGLPKLPRPTLCMVGVHKWHYYHKLLGPWSFFVRRCKRCDKAQRLNTHRDYNLWVTDNDVTLREDPKDVGE